MRRPLAIESPSPLGEPAPHSCKPSSLSCAKPKARTAPASSGCSPNAPASSVPTSAAAVAASHQAPHPRKCCSAPHTHAPPNTLYPATHASKSAAAAMPVRAAMQEPFGAPPLAIVGPPSLQLPDPLLQPVHLRPASAAAPPPHTRRPPPAGRPRLCHCRLMALLPSCRLPASLHGDALHCPPIDRLHTPAAPAFSGVTTGAQGGAGSRRDVAASGHGSPGEP
jgi:hypothetical protein